MTSRYRVALAIVCACAGVLGGRVGAACAGNAEEIAKMILQTQSEGALESAAVAAKEGVWRLDADADVAPLLAIAGDDSVRSERRFTALGAALVGGGEEALLQAFGVAARWAGHLPGDRSGEVEEVGRGHPRCD